MDLRFVGRSKPSRLDLIGFVLGFYVLAAAVVVAALTAWPSVVELLVSP